MKATGIVRRVDQLGRIVVPKEIRKVLHIHEGSAIEFFVDDNKQIILRKYSQLKDENKSVRTKCCMLEEVMQVPVFYYSQEGVLETGNENNSGWVDEKLTTGFCKASETYRETGFNDVQIFSNNADTYDGSIIPVVVEGEHYGAFVVLKNFSELTEAELQQAQLMCKLLEKELAQ